MAGQGLRRGRQPAGRGAAEEAQVIQLAGQVVGYVLRRSTRRTLGLQVTQRGVKVAVPWLTPESEIEALMRTHQGWLLGKLAEYRARVAPRQYVIEDGARLPVFGETCRIRFGTTGRAASWRLAADGIEELVLPCGGQGAAHLIRALRRRALPWFAERVAEYCYRLGRSVPPVRLSSARTRWGSCSSRSGIRLHWRLLHLPPALIDYVVAHEVAHLVEMNHSPRFWTVVERLYPGWRDARSHLREAARELPVIGADGSGESMNED